MCKDNNELPGTNFPLNFASTHEIRKYEEIAVDFFAKILKLNYKDCFVSDNSCLSDFDPLEGNDDPDTFKDKIIKRVRDTYGVDISDVYDTYLVDIFRRLKG